MAEFNFVPLSTQYQPKNALLLAKAAQLTYANNEDIVKNRLAEWGLPESYLFDKKDTQGFIASNDEAIIVAFRGTEPAELKDWMTDLNVWLEPGPRGEVHGGFQKALNLVWDEIWEQINLYQERTGNGPRLTGPGKSLWLTGHSLGAALATLATARLRLELDRGVFGLYTFGSPRVGDRLFADAFNAVFGKYAFRFVNNNDVVTRVPLRKMRYSHVGKLIYIDNDSNLQDDIGWWWHFLDRIQGRIEDFLSEEEGTEGIKDHDLNKYIKAIANHPSWRPG